MEVFEGLDDVGANQGQTAKVPLVKDMDVEGRGIQLLPGQELCDNKQDKATKLLKAFNYDSVTPQ